MTVRKIGPRPIMKMLPLKPASPKESEKVGESLKPNALLKILSVSKMSKLTVLRSSI